MMKLTKEKHGREVIIAVDGRIDATACPEFREMIKDAADIAEVLVLDFAKAEYISSAGLRVLLTAHKDMSEKGGLKIKNSNDNIMEIFELTGFINILNLV